MVLKIDVEAFPAKFALAGVYFRTKNYGLALDLTEEVLKVIPNEKDVIMFREKIKKLNQK